MSSRNNSHQLYLFSQLPLYCQFTFEHYGVRKVFVKTSATHALHNEKYQEVSQNILVFPVHPFCLVPPADPEWWEIVEPEQGADRPTDDLGDFVDEELL